ncbi:MAG TPA: molybdopterin cofactor-binding domain-containing protein [Thermoanaerobaculia bacterium]|nr:molybdopterin cofactor-binding domain-containing protein [Thermoanaerobaculia bacterium]
MTAAHAILFYVNGKRFEIADPDPTTLLIDWLRSDAIGLTGTKLSCGEGGCGACTVMLSRWEPKERRVAETAINSCLRPLCSLDGAMITTTEGIGSTREKLDPVQYHIAANNGSQCGFCTPGFVMNMFTFLRNNAKPKQRQIEDLFDGHLCRCTGYRPILEGMKSFAADFGKHSTYATNHRCFADVPIEQHLPGPRPALEFPPELIQYANRMSSLESAGRGYRWFRPATLEEAQQIKASNGGNSRNVKLVAGNTSIGIYKADVDDPHILIDIHAIPALLGFRESDQGLEIGAAESLQNVIDELQRVIARKPKEKTRGFAAFRAHLLDVANLQVRNIGSIGGNVMMTRAQAETDSPFPSDVYLVLETLGASITIASRDFDRGSKTFTMAGLPAVSALPGDAVAKSFHIPYSQAGDEIETFKIAYRDQNAHAIVNAGFVVRLDQKGTVQSAMILYGGLTPLPSRMTRTEAAITGARWTDATLQKALDVLAAEVAQVIGPMPGANFLPEGYRQSLAETLLYKFFLRVANRRFRKDVQPENRSGGEIYIRPLSGGTQTVSVYHQERPVGEPILKTTAFVQAAGEQKYTQDIPLPPHGYDSAFVISEIACGTFRYKGDASAALKAAQDKYDGIIAYITADDIPNKKNPYLGLGADDVVFALNQQIICWGQPIGLVVAKDRWAARRAAYYIQTEMIDFEPAQPVLTISEAVARKDFFIDQPLNQHIPFITRKGSDETWLKDPTKPMKGCDVVEGEMGNDAQEHFYMETQGALALPGAQGTMTIYAGTQQGSSVQSSVAQLLEIENSAVTVFQRPLGGGFGGKQARPLVINPAPAIAAWILDRPVRLILDRNTDMNVTGKRHPYQGRFHATFTKKGDIKGYKVQLYSNGGSTYDLSFPVMDLSQQHSDGAYFVPTWHSRGDVARTNNASNTAFRSFGVVQATLICEEAIEKIAHACGMRAEDVRWKNMYQDGSKRSYQSTPYAQELDQCNIRDLWKRLMKSSDFNKRRHDVDQFNAKNRWRKRGLTMIPLKYGVGYQPRLLDQGVAYVVAYAADGSVMVQHGGAESGQGIDTKMMQIAAETLGIDMSIIRVAMTSTDTMPNATPTAASSGSDLFGGAVRNACLELRARLEKYCKENNVKGWKSNWKKLWPSIVGGAYAARVNLAVDGFYSTPLIGDVEGTSQYGRAFLYFVYAAGASEVEIDVLTGETTVLRSDILIDIGHSLNPCLDVGQVEGAFVQGLGLMTTEQMMYEPDGRLYSNGTWEYKPPCSKSIPVDLRVTIAKGGDPNQTDSAVMSSRGIGEPPLVLSTSAFFAIKQAIMAARRDQGDDTWFAMPAPATVGRVQSNCRVARHSMHL